jgi:uroporphyrinogen decarboxylase
MTADSPNFDRVLTALHCQEPDRVPPAEIWVDQEVRDAYMGFPVRSLQDEVNFWQTAGFDFIALDNDLWSMPQIQDSITSPIRDTAHIYSGGRNDRGWVDEQSGVVKTWKDVELFPWPSAADLDYSSLEKMGALLPPGMKVICTFGHIFTAAWQLMGFENFCVALHDDYPLVKDIVKRVGVECVRQAEHILTFDCVGAVCFQDDIAYTSGPIISLKMLRELFFPWLAELANLSHAHGRPLIYHTDGDATLLLPDMVAAGIDCFQAVEPKCMDIVAVKQAYGDRLALMGNLDLGYTLTRGTPQEVEENVKFLIKHVAPGGGLLLGSCNSITNYVPMENFKTMMRAVLQYGRYPINL